MVAGSLGTLLTAHLQSKVSENCLQSSKSLWGCVASLWARWVPEAWFEPARTTISLLTAAVVVTDFLWPNSTVQISKDISSLYAAIVCFIYLFTLGWFVLTRWEGNCGNPLLEMVGVFAIPAWFSEASWYHTYPTFELATNFAVCGLLFFLCSLLSIFLVRRVLSSHSPNGQTKDPTGRKRGCALFAG